MSLTIDVNVNFPGVTALFSQLEGNIMGIKEDLQASTAALVAKIEESNTKTDALILTANQTKDALVALQQQAGSGVPVTAADLQAIIDQQTTALASLTAQETETDAAAAAVAP